MSSWKTSIKKKVDRLSDYILDRDSRDIHRAMQRRALEDTSLFVEENMYRAPAFTGKFDLLDHALKSVRVNNGLYCEFGVFSGATINFTAERVNGPVYGFDSFEGLPEDWRPGVKKGHFAMTKLPEVRQNVRLIKGWFSESLPGFLEANSTPAAFLHIDCDLYSSTRTVLELIARRIVPGTVIVFDEFFNYPGWRKGEYLALEELAAAERLAYEYIGYVGIGQQAAIQIVDRAA